MSSSFHKKLLPWRQGRPALASCRRVHVAFQLLILILFLLLVSGNYSSRRRGSEEDLRLHSGPHLSAGKHNEHMWLLVPRHSGIKRSSPLTPLHRSGRQRRRRLHRRRGVARALILISGICHQIANGMAWHGTQCHAVSCSPAQSIHPPNKLAKIMLLSLLNATNFCVSRLYDFAGSTSRP